jgi:hypothetical protein
MRRETNVTGSKMMVLSVVGVAIGAMVFGGLHVQPAFGSEWSSIAAGEQEKGLRAVAVDPLNPKKLFIGSDKGVYVSTDTGKNWRKVLDLSKAVRSTAAEENPVRQKIVESMRTAGGKGGISGATAIAIDPANSKRVIAGAVNGLYLSLDGGENWSKADGLLEAIAPCILDLAVDPINPNQIYAATLDSKLLSSTDGGRTWNKVEVAAGEVGDDSVLAVAVHPFDPNVVYAGTMKALYKSRDGAATWKKIYPEIDVCRSIAIEPVHPSVMYLGTASGLYKSGDGGASWMNVGVETLSGKQVCEVTVAPADSTAVYAATTDGIYGSSDRGISWQKLSKDAQVKGAMALAFDPVNSATVWAATASGLYKTAVAQAQKAESTVPGEAPVDTLSLEDESAPAGEEGPPVPTVDDVKIILGQFSHEPTVQEIQEVAMRFAEVHPDLIESWRKGAKWRGLLPEFTFRVDFDRQNQTEYRERDEVETKDRELYSEQRSDGTEITPVTGLTLQTTVAYTNEDRFDTEVLSRIDNNARRRRDRDIRFQFEWELGDLLYSKDQVRISDEARDLVELRNDVLEEVTQFYFQRRQLQIELLLSPPEDLRERLRMELQLQEVTANVDYLTGGYLTQRLNEVKEGKTSKTSFFKRLVNI